MLGNYRVASRVVLSSKQSQINDRYMPRTAAEFGFRLLETSSLERVRAECASWAVLQAMFPARVVVSVS
jgi:hypothetical protein